MEEQWKVPGKYTVSQFNFAEEVVADYEFPEEVPIWDCTILKLGRTPGARIYSVEENLEIAAMMDDIGVAGLYLNPDEFYTEPMAHPARHKVISDTIRAITKGGFKFDTSGVARFPVLRGSYKEALDRIIDMGLNLIYIHPAPQWKWEKYPPEWTPDRILGQCADAVEYVKSQRVGVGVCFPHFVWTDLDESAQLLNRWLDLGVDMLHVSDSFGTLSPQGTRYVFKTLGKKLNRKVPIMYHVHNSFGMATAQLIAAVAAGAWPEVAVNGIADGAFVNLDEVVLSLEVLYGVRTGIKLEKLTEVSQLVERITGIKNHSHKPIVGESTHVPLFEADYIGMFRGEPYESGPFAPEMVGKGLGLVWWDGMLSPATVKAKLEQLGLQCNEEQVNKVKEAVAGRLSRLKEFPLALSDAEVEEICRQVVS